MDWKNLYAVALAATYLSIAPFANAESCNFKESPWLTPECKAPSITNPADACRRVAFMKSQGLTYEGVLARARTYDTKSDRFTNAQEILIAPKSWEICNSAMEMQCLQNAVSSVTTYKSLMGVYISYRNEALPPYVGNDLNAKRFDLNLERNFQIISASNLAILSDTKSFSETMSENRSKIESRADLERSEKQLNEFGTQVVRKSKILSQNESRFLSLLDQSIQELDDQSLRNSNLSRGVDCSLFADKLSQYTDDLIEYKKLVIDYKNSIIRLRNSRYKAVALAFNHTKYNNLVTYALKFNLKVEDLVTDLGKVQALDRFMWVFNDFWSERFKNGLADNLHTRFYYYSEPLAKLEILREELSGIRKSATNLPVDEAARNEVVSLIDSKIKMTDRDLNFIKSKGWEGFLALQKASASKRIEIATANKPCVELSKEFLSRAELIRSLEDFDSLSPFYKDSVNSCGSSSK